MVTKKTRKKASGRGGRRHGLNEKGEAQSFLMRLSHAQRAWLDGAALSSGIGIADVIRDLIDREMAR